MKRIKVPNTSRDFACTSNDWPLPMDSTRTPSTCIAEPYSKDFFGKPTALTVSGQLEGELGATALGAIYTFGPTFRAENSNTPRHLSEFWMIEPEVSFFDITDNMQLWNIAPAPSQSLAVISGVFR